MNDQDKQPSVIVVDDDRAIMQCVGTFLQREGVQILGYASHAQAGLAMALQLKPDLVLSDIHMDGADAFWAAQEVIRQSDEQIQVLFYTSFPRDQYLDRCIAVGASGMVCKHSETIQDLAVAIRHVLSGQTYFSRELARRLVELESGAKQSPMATLTHREIEVVRYLAQGHTNGEIAELVDLSIRSIEKAIFEVKKKLQLKTTNELLIFAANEGMVFPELQYLQ